MDGNHDCFTACPQAHIVCDWLTGGVEQAGLFTLFTKVFPLS
jgi:hypothetical protein